MNMLLQKKKRPHEGGVGLAIHSPAGSMSRIVTPVGSHVKSMSKGHFGGKVSA